MKPRDLRWRLVGAAMYASACGSQISRSASEYGVFDFLTLTAAAFGAVFMINGRSTVLALRIEASNHRMLPRAIRAQRLEIAGQESSESR